MFEQIAPGLFVVRYRAAEDLEPARQAPLVESLRAASGARRVAVVFVVGPGVRTVDVAVPAFWLDATSDPAVRLAAMAIVSGHAGVRLATAGFGAANVVRGARFRVRGFDDEREAIAWANATRGPGSPAAKA